MSWFSAARARWQLLFAREATESRMNDEMAFHIEMETDRLVREQKLSREEARRRALVTFGGVTQHKEAMRDARGFAWLGGLSLDFKLGFRMLRKYPGLTIVGGLAMAFAIWVGAVAFQMVMLGTSPTLPLPDGDRIVRIRNYDVAETEPESRVLYEFTLWRQSLSSIVDIGAFRDVTRNVIAADGKGRAVDVAEMTASGFRIAPTRPLMGRVLAASDEKAGAAPVVVLGYDVWRHQFASDPAILGRSVQLGDVFATVVGVMPEGFAFPMAHDLWMPLRIDLLNQTPREGPAITVFGRLAPGASLEMAEAELATIGKRLASEFPATHKHLRPEIGKYTDIFFKMDGSEFWFLASINVFVIMLIILICSNVALLLFARAATRETELVVRSALGASRGRIVMQLFTEALVLGSVAATAGLVLASIAMEQWGGPFLETNLGRLPFWYDFSLSPLTILYSLGVTLLAAAIAGIMPALKITRGLGARLKQATAGGGGVQFGGVWTAIIIIQVAFTVAFPAIAYVEQKELRRIQSFDVGFAADQYLAVQVAMDAPAASAGPADSLYWAARAARYGAALERLRERVSAEPGVRGVTFVDRVPRMFHREALVELDDDAAAAALARRAATHTDHNAVNEVAMAAIHPSYFDVLQTPILAGRAFNLSETPEARTVIVDEGFVERILQGQNAIGQRVRFAPRRLPDGTMEEQPWFEIIGVVRDLGMSYVAHRHRAAGIYFPTNLHVNFPLHMLVHVQGDPMAMSGRVHELTAAVDPTLRLSEISRASEVANRLLWLLGLWMKITAVLIAVALLLSLAGIYAVMSFTVARRTREIGVRVALGASRERLVAAIFRRPLRQVAFGVAGGGTMIAAVALLFSAKIQDAGFRMPEMPSIDQILFLLGYVVLMLIVCLLACVVPTRRALRVEPMEALRAD